MQIDSSGQSESDFSTPPDLQASAESSTDDGRLFATSPLSSLTSDWEQTETETDTDAEYADIDAEMQEDADAELLWLRTIYRGNPMALVDEENTDLDINPDTGEVHANFWVEGRQWRGRLDAEVGPAMPAGAPMPPMELLLAAAGAVEQMGPRPLEEAPAWFRARVAGNDLRPPLAEIRAPQWEPGNGAVGEVPLWGPAPAARVLPPQGGRGLSLIHI